MTEPTLHDLMVQKLHDELGDGALAAQLADDVMDIALSWKAPTIACDQVNTIVAYAFGNRARAAPDTGRAEPGPINEELARTVLAVRQIKPVKIFAQWEIAEFLTPGRDLRDVASIEPRVESDGSLQYLSTEGVAGDIIRQVGGDGARLGVVAVIAHRDHAKRCVQISRRLGMNAFIPREVELPLAYDPLSGQSWTRRRDIYLAHDLAAQFLALRAAGIAKFDPPH